MSTPTNTKKKLLAAVLAVLATASLAFGGYYVWLTTPPDMPQTMEEALDVIDSARFKRLPDERKAAYLEKMNDLRGQLTPEQRQAMRDRFDNDPQLRESMHEVFEQMMYQRAKEFVLADPEQRQKMLDDMTDMGEMMRRRGGGGWGNGGTRGNRDNGGNRTGPPVDRMTRMQMRLEHGDPQKQAYIGEFFKALRLRREERGLEPWPQFRGRRD